VDFLIQTDMKLKYQGKAEIVFYLIIWIIIFSAPVLGVLYKSFTLHGFPFKWGEVFHVWSEYLPFLLLFLLHNFVVAPLLLFKKNKWYYAIAVVAMLVLFALLSNKPRPERLRDGVRTEMRADNPEGVQRNLPPDLRQAPSGQQIIGTPPPNRNPMLFDVHGFFKFVMGLLLIAMNTAMKMYFKGQQNEQELQALRNQSLQQELVYLRYQINPHFFMNTLNNIHALVDVDPEKAKSSIIDFGHLMRHVLYESEKPTIELAKEIEFLQQYVKLMRMRYDEKVKIDLEVPQEVPDVQVPPLLFLNFLENAFKHGVSYQEPSFIKAAITLPDGKLRFTCQNSIHANANSQEEHGGIGLANVHKRLDLLYPGNYDINISDAGNVYKVTLTIPIKTEEL